MRIRLLLAISVIGSFSGSTIAQVTGHNLVETQQAYQKIRDKTGTNSDVYPAGYFLGYITGTTDILYIAKVFCPPKGTNKGQYAAILQKYLKEHPETWNEEAHIIVTNSLREVFPCK